MTIPIRPGPFSFLAQLGQAGGNAFEQHQKDVDRKYIKNRDKLNTVLDMIKEGYFRSSVLAEPEFQQLYSDLGLGKPSTEPTVRERTMDIEKQYLRPDKPAAQFQLPGVPEVMGSIAPSLNAPIQVPATGPHTLTDQQLAFAKLPAKVETLSNQRGAAAIEAGGAAGRFVSKVPSEEVAAAAEFGQTAQSARQQSQYFGEEADSYVAQALMGKDPKTFGVNETVEGAMAAYTADLQAGNKIAKMPPEVAKRYFADAAQKRMDYLQNQRIAALRAANVGSSVQDPELGAINVQVDNAANQVAGLLAAIDKAEKELGGIPYEMAITMPQYQGTAMQVASLKAQLAKARSSYADLISRYDQRLQVKFPSVGPSTGSPNAVRQKEWDDTAHWWHANHPGEPFPPGFGERPQ